MTWAACMGEGMKVRRMRGCAHGVIEPGAGSNVQVNMTTGLVAGEQDRHTSEQLNDRGAPRAGMSSVRQGCCMCTAARTVNSSERSGFTTRHAWSERTTGATRAHTALRGHEHWIQGTQSTCTTRKLRAPWPSRKPQPQRASKPGADNTRSTNTLQPTRSKKNQVLHAPPCTSSAKELATEGTDLSSGKTDEPTLPYAVESAAVGARERAWEEPEVRQLDSLPVRARYLGGQAEGVGAKGAKTGHMGAGTGRVGAKTGRVALLTPSGCVLACRWHGRLDENT